MTHYTVNRNPQKSKGCFAATHTAMLSGEESLTWLNANCLKGEAMSEPIPCFNSAWGDEKICRKRLDALCNTQKKRVHLLALGDVGSTVLMGLKLLGGDTISKIGILDLNENVRRRYEYEMNQISWPWEYDRLPEVELVAPEDTFACDVFVFCASKGVPPVGQEGKDVRMVQLEENRKIVSAFAKQAAQANYQGLFAVVSDPVDPLCKAAFRAGEGKLWPEQIQGYGLGVMNARAAYFAKRDERFASFLTEGRAFGPHGQDLIIANSVEHYDDALSRELTGLAVTANLKTRETGFKPYLAPAISSAAMSLILTMEQKWHYGSVFIGGTYMGCKNRFSPAGVMVETLPMPDALYQRLERAYKNLEAID
jgi:hypothetical protein